MRKPRTLFRYSQNFKSEAVAITRIQGTVLADVARALDLHPTMLSFWRSQERDGKLDPAADVARASTPPRRRSRQRERRREMNRQQLAQAEQRLREVRAAFEARSRRQDPAEFRNACSGA